MSEIEFFQIIETIDKLIKQPSMANFDQLSHMISSNLSLREYFYSEVESSWVDILASRNVFNEPAEPKREGEYLSYPRWAESEYLKRIAKDAEEKVVYISLKVPKTKNFRVLENIIDIGLKVKPKLAKEIADRVIREDWLTIHPNMTIAQKLGTMVEKLAKGGEGTTALRLAKYVLDVETAMTDFSKMREQGADWEDETKPKPKFDSYIYQKIIEENLQSLVEVNGLETLKILCDLLSDATKIDAGDDGDRDGLSYISRPAIEENTRNLMMGIGDILISGVRDAGQMILGKDESYILNIVNLLATYKWSVFKRIILNILSYKPAASMDLVTKYLSDTDSFDNPDHFHEYAVLLRKCFDKIGDARKDIIGFIRNGPDLEEYKIRMKDWREEEITDGKAQSYKRHWQWQNISALGDKVPPELSELYERLNSEFGGNPYPDFLTPPTESFFGPISPKETKELSEMSDDELFEYLKAFKPESNWKSPTPEGLARELKKVIAADPERFVKQTNKFKPLDKIYVRTFFDALKDADTSNISWEKALELAKWVVDQPIEVVERDRDRPLFDKDWGWTRAAIVNLLSSELQPVESKIPFEFKDQIWEVIYPVTDAPDPQPEDEDYEKSGSDPFTRSINTTRGQAFHALMEYAFWNKRHQKEITLDDIPEVKEVLDNHLDPEIDPSPAIRAVYARFFPWLVNLDRDWAIENLDRIFPSRADDEMFFEASWGTYVATLRPFTDIWPILKRKYEEAIDLVGTQMPKRGFLPNIHERLADHLVILYWRGELPLNGPDGWISKFYSKAPADLRKHVINFVGRSLKGRGSEIKEEELIRVKEFWEWRLKTAKEAENKDEFLSELAAFGWWLEADNIEHEWLLDQLKEILDLTKFIDPDFYAVKMFLDTIHKYPVKTLDCLRKIVDIGQSRFGIGFWSQDAYEILKTAMQITDPPEVRAKAEGLINIFGSLGFYDFGKLLEPTDNEGEPQQ